MEETIAAVIRIRPQNKREKSLNGRNCVQVPNQTDLYLDSKPEPKNFKFNYVADESVDQDTFFRTVGASITQNCLDGYNGTVICYGTTGTGKSHTTFGCEQSADAISGQLNPQRGLVPRSLEYLYNNIKNRQRESGGKVSFSSKCSFYEIYQERVFDLLDCAGNGAMSLNVRDDGKRGVYIDGITEEIVNSPDDASHLLLRGYENRHVGETTMNRESSRSHAVFVLTLSSREEHDNGTATTRISRFSFVDLAGSERQKDTNTSGTELKVAGQINQSLSELGNVIDALHNKRAHVPYRNSKLTFLLRDSLGGNTKTVLIATISPSNICIDETLSTLKFAQRVQSIKKVVGINEETSGSIPALQKEIDRLKSELEVYQQGLAPPRHMPSLTRGGEGDSTGKRNLAAEIELRLQLLMPILLSRLQQAEKWAAEGEAQAATGRLRATSQSAQSRGSRLPRFRSTGGKLPLGGDNIAPDDQAPAAPPVCCPSVASEPPPTPEMRHLYEELLRYGSDIACVNSPSAFDPSSLDPLRFLDLVCLLRTPSEEGKLPAAGQRRLGELQGELTLAQQSASSFAQALEQYREDQQVAVKVLNGTLIGLEDKLKAVSEQRDSKSEKLLMLEQELHVSKSECQRISQDMEKEVKLLQLELTAKSESLRIAEQDLRRSETESLQALKQREKESLMEHNRCMKDNVVLISMCRELEQSLEDKNQEVKVCLDAKAAVDEKCSQLLQSLEQLLAVKDRAEAELASKLQAITELEKDHLALQNVAGGLRATISQQEAEAQRQSETILALTVVKDAAEAEQERLKGLEGELLQLKRVYEKVCFERDNALEDADNNYLQVETLLADRQRFIAERDEAMERAKSLDEPLESLKAANEALNLECAAKQQQLDSLATTVTDLEEFKLQNSTLHTQLAEHSDRTIKLQEQLEQKGRDIEELQRGRDEKAQLLLRLETENSRLFDRTEELLEKNRTAEEKAAALGERIKIIEDKYTAAEEARVLIAVQEVQLAAELKLRDDSVHDLTETLREKDKCIHDLRETLISRDCAVATSASAINEVVKEGEDEGVSHTEADIIATTSHGAQLNVAALEELLAAKDAELLEMKATAAVGAIAQDELARMTAQNETLKKQLMDLEFGHSNIHQKIHTTNKYKAQLAAQTDQLNEQRQEILKMAMEKDRAEGEIQNLRRQLKENRIDSQPQLGSGKLPLSKDGTEFRKPAPLGEHSL